MASYVKFQATIENIFEGVHNLGADTLKVVLTNTAPTVATDTILSNITQIANGNGYTTGGETTAQSSSAQSGGTYKLVLADITWTAIGSMGPFRYAVLYNDTPTSPVDPLLGYWDYGSAVTLAATETFTWDADPTTGVIQAS